MTYLSIISGFMIYCYHIETSLLNSNNALEKVTENAIFPKYFVLIFMTNAISFLK
jgi:hypothetical protein